MKGNIRSRVIGSVVRPLAVFASTTQRIPAEVLESLVKECRKKPLAHTCPAERK